MQAQVCLHQTPGLTAWEECVTVGQRCEAQAKPSRLRGRGYAVGGRGGGGAEELWLLLLGGIEASPRGTGARQSEREEQTPLRPFRGLLGRTVSRGLPGWWGLPRFVTGNNGDSGPEAMAQVLGEGKFSFLWFSPAGPSREPWWLRARDSQVSS